MFYSPLNHLSAAANNASLCFWWRSVTLEEENNEKAVFATLLAETKRLWGPAYKNLFCIFMKMLKLDEGIEHIWFVR